MDSTFQQHLGTNYVPSIDEIRDIKKIVEASAKEVCNINVEIEELQKRTKLLKEKRSKVNDHLEQYRALISPVRRLSRDILEEIFLACLPEDHNPCMSAAEAPMLLTHICSSWRTVAHLTPWLWAAIHIVLPSVCPAAYSMYGNYHPPSPREDLVQYKLNKRQVAAKEWLDRSLACPLSLSVYESPGFQTQIVVEEDYQFTVERDQRLHLSFMKDIFVSYSKRWYKVDVFFSPQLLNSLCENGVLTAQHMLMLKKIHITCRTLDSNFSREDNPVSFLKWENIISILSPRLISATLFGFPIYRSDLNRIPDLVWERLTEMNLDTRCRSWLDPSDISPATFAIAVLRYCRSLQILKLDICSRDGISVADDPWNDSNIKPITLPHLTLLSFAAKITQETMGFVKCLSMPALKKLNLKLSRSDSRDASTQMGKEILAILLRDCGDNLQFLALYKAKSSTLAGNMVQLLRLTPNLKHLKLSSTTLNNNRWRSASGGSYNVSRTQIIDDDFLSALSPLGKDYFDIICPNLEVLECDGCVTRISASALNEFVKARKCAHLLDQRIAILQHLDISVDEPEPKEETEKEIQSLLGNSTIRFRRGETVEFPPSEGLNLW